MPLFTHRVKRGKHALIICPNGHFYRGRYRKDQQQRLGTLARMGGCLCGLRPLWMGRIGKTSGCGSA